MTRSLPYVLAGTLVAVLVGLTLWATDGHLAYTQDDPWIHLSMADNLVHHRVWGVVPGTFSASTSSPAWTTLLAGFQLLVGRQDWAPLALCLALIPAVIWAAERLLGDLPAVPRAVTLCGLVLATPLPLLASTGMEHVLHSLLVLLWVEALLAPQPRRSLLLLAPALTATRYESFALLAIGVFLLRRHPRLSAGVLFSGLLPPALIGALQLAHGWWGLPATILLKSGGVEELWQRPFTNLQSLPLVMPLFSITALSWLRHRQQTLDASSLRLAVLGVGALLAHLLFGRTTTHYMRYEAYLVALSVVVLARLAWHDGWVFGLQGRSPAVRISSLLLGPLCIGALASRALMGLSVPIAAQNIYQQQLQMARWCAVAIPSQPVVLNDIGAVSFRGTGQVIDLAGLAQLQVARARIENRYTPEVVAQVSQGARVAILYDSWVPQAIGLPEAWVPIARWTIPHPLVVSPTVTFYATSAAQVAPLRRSLIDFEPSLPPGVRVRYTE